MLQRRFALHFRKLFGKNLPKQVLVACSGGLDSMALLDLLAETYKGKEGELSVCYVDHAQRPDTAQDIKVIKTYCRARKIPFLLRKIRTLKPGASEAALREARYQELAAVLPAQGWVMTAHHADDLLETYFLKLLRGAHPSTIRGILAKSRREADEHTLRLARPLLPFSKAEIFAYAKTRELVWREDSTNQSPRYGRNRIRNELLPLLENLRPGSTQRALAFFQNLEEFTSQSKAPLKTTIESLKATLQTQPGHPVQSLNFLTLKSALDSLLRQSSSRTTRAHWNSVKRILSARHATRNGGGPRKIVQFPGEHALCFQGSHVLWAKKVGN
jgi:tRNA(Ile)-lysidine synthetase-like protein